MKRVLKNTIYIFLLSILFFSCKTDKIKPVQTIDEATQIDTINSKKSEKQYTILRTMFVSSKNGVNYREKPNGKKSGVFPFNKQVDIIEYSDSIDVTIQGKVINSFWVGVEHNGKKVYVVNAYLYYDKDVSNLISENEYYIFIDELFKEQMVTKYKNDSTVIDEFPLKDFISIKPISKNKFEEIYKKNNRLTQILHPKEKDTVLSINCSNGKGLVWNDLTFSKVEYDEQVKTYDYIGTYEAINSHLIRTSYYESTDFFLVNNENCNITNFFGEPVFNADFSKLIGISTDSFEYSEVSIYDYEKGKVNSKYFFEIDFMINRSVLVDNSFYVESNTNWHDGKIQKFSEQFFEITFKEEI